MKRSEIRRSSPEKVRAWQARSARKYSNRRRRSPAESAKYSTEREAAVLALAGRCGADGMHHPDCPGYANRTHHILPREHGGPDTRENLLPVWGGDSGIDGCHLIVHTERQKAIELGYLRRRPGTAATVRD